MERMNLAVVDTRGNAVTSFRVTVYEAGTSTKPTIYSDNGVTPKANPFDVASLSGEAFFYAANGRYDYTITNGPPGMDDKFVGDNLLYDPFGGSISDFPDIETGGTTIDFSPGDNLDLLAYDAALQEWRAMHPVTEAALDQYFARVGDYTDGVVWIRANSTVDAPFLVTQQGSGNIADFRQGAVDGAVVASVTNTGGLVLSDVIDSNATGVNTFDGDIQVADGKVISSPTAGTIMLHRASTSSLDISHAADVNVFIDANNNEVTARFAVWHNGSVEGSSTILFDVHETDGVRAYGDVVIDGDLTVNGSQTIVNSNEVHIGDNIIILNSDEAGVPTQNAGIEIERGTLANSFFGWMESPDRFQWSPDLVTYYTIPGLERNETVSGNWTFSASPTFQAGAVLTNNDAIYGIEVGGTQRIILRLNSSDTVAVGNTSLPLSILSSGAVDFGNVGIVNVADPTLGTHLGDRDYNDVRYLRADASALDAQINAFTTDAAPDGAADFLIFYDVSEGVVNKVLINDLVAAGGGGGGGGLADPGANGVVVRTALDTTTARSIAAGDGISVTNADGTAGNPTIAVSADVARTTGDTFTGDITISKVNPAINLTDTDGTDSDWQIWAANSILRIRDVNGADDVVLITQAGTMTVDGDGTFNASDARLKKDFREFDDPIALVKKLRGGVYKWDKAKCVAAGFKNFDNEEHVGFRAQDVAAVHADLAPLAPFDASREDIRKSRTGEHYLTARYDRSVVVVAAALNRVIEALEREGVKL